MIRSIGLSDGGLTTADASKANKARFTKPRLYQFVIAVWRAKETDATFREPLQAINLD